MPAAVREAEPRVGCSCSGLTKKARGCAKQCRPRVLHLQVCLVTRRGGRAGVMPGQETPAVQERVAILVGWQSGTLTSTIRFFARGAPGAASHKLSWGPAEGGTSLQSQMERGSGEGWPLPQEQHAAGEAWLLTPVHTATGTAEAGTSQPDQKGMVFS